MSYFVQTKVGKFIYSQRYFRNLIEEGALQICWLNFCLNSSKDDCVLIIQMRMCSTHKMENIFPLYKWGCFSQDDFFLQIQGLIFSPRKKEEVFNKKVICSTYLYKEDVLYLYIGMQSTNTKEDLFFCGCDILI
jgi:hypothetical protein